MLLAFDGRSQGCCETSYNAQDRPPPPPAPKMSVALRLRNGCSKLQTGIILINAAVLQDGLPGHFLLSEVVSSISVAFTTINVLIPAECTL